MLTARQLMRLTTDSSRPPWILSSLRNSANLGQKDKLSLRQAVNQVSARKAVMFVCIADASILQSAESLAGIQNSVPSQATFDNLKKNLAAFGVSIVYKSQDQKTWGLAGTVGQLLAVPAIKVTAEDIKTDLGDIWNGVKDLGSGVSIIATAIGAAAAAEQTGFAGQDFFNILGFTGAAAGGLQAGVGTGEVIQGTWDLTIDGLIAGYDLTKELFTDAVIALGIVPPDIDVEVIVSEPISVELLPNEPPDDLDPTDPPAPTDPPEDPPEPDPGANGDTGGEPGGDDPPGDGPKVKPELPEDG